MSYPKWSGSEKGQAFVPYTIIWCETFIQVVNKATSPYNVIVVVLSPKYTTDTLIKRAPRKPNNLTNVPKKGKRTQVGQ